MNAENLVFNITTVILIIGGVSSLLTIWFNLNNKVKEAKTKIDNIDNEIVQYNRENVMKTSEIIETINSKDVILHKRIDRIRNDVNTNRDNLNKSVSEVKSTMQEMEIRIIKAIHEITSKND